MNRKSQVDYEDIFSSIIFEMTKMDDDGEVASYIPELSNIDPDQFGVHLTTIDNQNFAIGDSEQKFSIQSIVKVLTLTMAYKIQQKNLWLRVGVEPSGTPFNSLVQLEYEKGIPRNPFINAGALVICDILLSHVEDPEDRFLTFVRSLAGNQEINYCQKTMLSEKLTGFKNAALTNLMKAYGNIFNPVDQVLDLYFKFCSVEMTCQQLARAFLFLANDGINPIDQKRIIGDAKSKRINAIMLLCGFYDEAGEFAFKVGLPGKSGVGGGIVAVHPGQYSVAAWSPRLNEKGNSVKAMKFLELLTTHTQSSIF